MKVNGIDIRKFGAKQLTADIQPPSFSVNYEWVEGAAVPVEFDTEVTAGNLKLSLYFRGKDRNSIIRSASELMKNFTKVCDLEIDGYKGKYRGLITGNDFEKTKVKTRYIINLEFDGYFYDDEIEITFDGKKTDIFYVTGTRKTPCKIEVYAKEELKNYVIKGLGEDEIIIEKLEVGKTMLIDGEKGIVTVDGANAFDRINMWSFPVMETGEKELHFSGAGAIVKVRYCPMWL